MGAAFDLLSEVTPLGQGRKGDQRNRRCVVGRLLSKADFPVGFFGGQSANLIQRDARESSLIVRGA
jgi:hypothetical protein